jgi:hypothetical protein
MLGLKRFPLTLLRYQTALYQRLSPWHHDVFRSYSRCQTDYRGAGIRNRKDEFHGSATTSGTWLSTAKNLASNKWTFSGVDLDGWWCFRQAYENFQSNSQQWHRNRPRITTAGKAEQAIQKDFPEEARSRHESEAQNNHRDQEGGEKKKETGFRKSL